MDMQWGADGAFYLLTYGDGFFNINPDAGMYKLGVRQGPARAEGRAHRRQDRRRAAADGQLLERRLAATPDPGDSISFDWDFGDGSAALDRPEPEPHLHERAAATPPS